jgi:hypothetical protein
METITTEINYDGLIRVAEDEGDQTTTQLLKRLI